MFVLKLANLTKIILKTLSSVGLQPSVLLKAKIYLFCCLFSTSTRPWITTGLFPQFFSITFPDLMLIQKIQITGRNGKHFNQRLRKVFFNFTQPFTVKDILVERSTTERVANYEEVAEKTLNKSDRIVEEILSNEEVTAQHLKFTIKSGYEDFVGIFSVEVMGNLASGRSPTMMRKTARLVLSA